MPCAVPPAWTSNNLLVLSIGRVSHVPPFSVSLDETKEYLE